MYEHNDYLNCGSVFRCSLCLWVFFFIFLYVLAKCHCWKSLWRAIRFSFLARDGKVANSTKSLVSDKKRHDEKRSCIQRLYSHRAARVHSSDTYTNGSRAHNQSFFLNWSLAYQTNVYPEYNSKRSDSCESVFIGIRKIYLYESKAAAVMCAFFFLSLFG